MPTSVGIDVLVAVDVAPHRRDVDAALVREGALADIGQMIIRREVGDLGDGARDERQMAQTVVGQAVIAHLQFKIGDDAAQIGVAAALAVAVDRPLHMSRARLNRRQGVGNRQFAIVMGVNADHARPGNASRAAVTKRAISQGSVPPLVSHSTIASAPPSIAARSVSKPYSKSSFTPSKKCSAS